MESRAKYRGASAFYWMRAPMPLLIASVPPAPHRRKRRNRTTTDEADDGGPAQGKREARPRADADRSHQQVGQGAIEVRVLAASPGRPQDAELSIDEVGHFRFLLSLAQHGPSRRLAGAGKGTTHARSHLLLNWEEQQHAEAPTTGINGWMRPCIRLASSGPLSACL